MHGFLSEERLKPICGTMDNRLLFIIVDLEPTYHQPVPGRRMACLSVTQMRLGLHQNGKRRGYNYR